MMYCIRIASSPSALQKSHRFTVTNVISVSYLHSIKEREELKRCYKVLNLPHDCDQEQLRSSFLELVKKYHPDSGSPEASATRFQEIESAYRIIQDNFSKQRWDLQNVGGEYGLYHCDENQNGNKEVKEFDIKHTAPQHRQYLSYDGVGYGTPRQRQKQYQKYRAAVAIENLYDHRVSKIRATSIEDALINQDKKAAKKIKTRYGMDRLVEDLIQESMARGEFDNLRGKGKPLPQGVDNPYVDFVTHKINQVLIDNGFVPEWISLQKEIGEEATKIRDTLRKSRECLGTLPLSPADQHHWNQCIENVQQETKKLNEKITKYNLVVPLMQKQMLLFKLEKESERILQEIEPRCDRSPSSRREQTSVKPVSSQNNTSLFSILSSFFFH